MKNVTDKKPELNIRILKIASCPSITKKSTLTYQIGCTPEGAIHLRVYANSAAGFFSQEWVPWQAIDEALSQGGGEFTSLVLQPMFRGKSMNNPAFLLAVLLSEGLVGPAPGKQRCHQKLNPDRFLAEIKALIDSKVTLNARDKPAKADKKISADNRNKDKTESGDKAKPDSKDKTNTSDTSEEPEAKG
ncbi:MAG: hypothetical protein ACR65R_09755 [Methylomicrobium sp.]